jgi:hypothetical protein
MITLGSSASDIWQASFPAYSGATTAWQTFPLIQRGAEVIDTKKSEIPIELSLTAVVWTSR